MATRIRLLYIGGLSLSWNRKSHFPLFIRSGVYTITVKASRTFAQVARPSHPTPHASLLLPLQARVGATWLAGIWQGVLLIDQRKRLVVQYTTDRLLEPKIEYRPLSDINVAQCR